MRMAGPSLSMMNSRCASQKPCVFVSDCIVFLPHLPHHWFRDVLFFHACTTFASVGRRMRHRLCWKEANSIHRIISESESAAHY